jgi:hypothetical protein
MDISTMNDVIIVILLVAVVVLYIICCNYLATNIYREAPHGTYSDQNLSRLLHDLRQDV